MMNKIYFNQNSKLSTLLDGWAIANKFYYTTEAVKNNLKRIAEAQYLYNLYNTRLNTSDEKNSVRYRWGCSSRAEK